MQLRKRQHRQQGEHCSHGAEELTKEPGLQRHAQQDERKQRNAHTEALRRQTQSRQAGKHLPRACAGQHLFLPGHIQCYQPCQQQIFDLLPQKHRPLRQTELLFAVEQLFLDKPGQRPDGITQAAKGAGVSAEKPVEQQSEAAQPQQRKREAVRCEHFACTDVQKDLLYPGKTGHKCARHGHKEEQLHPGAQPCTALFVLLALLRRCQRLCLCFFHHPAAFPSASSTAPMRPSAVRVAPETVSTPADCIASISSSKGSACL